MTQTTGLLEWARRSIRKGEQQMLLGLVAFPWIILVSDAWTLTGLPGDWWAMLPVLLLVVVGRALLRRRDAEQRLLVYWLLCGTAFLVGIVAVLMVLVVRAIRETRGVSGADDFGALVFAAAAAGVALVAFVLVQIYYRIHCIEQGSSGLQKRARDSGWEDRS